MYCFPQTSVYISVHFRYKNAYALECVTHLGYCQEFRWILIHYGIYIASAIHV